MPVRAGVDAARMAGHQVPTKPRFFPPLPPPLVPMSETAIDPILEKGLRTLEVCSETVSEILPAFRKLWSVFKQELEHVERDKKTGRMTEQARARARKELGAIVNLFDRLSKGMEYHSRVTDAMTRLRLVMSGAADRRQELDICLNVKDEGETRLMALVLKAAAEGGQLCPNCTRKALEGPINGREPQIA